MNEYYHCYKVNIMSVYSIPEPAKQLASLEISRLIVIVIALLFFRHSYGQIADEYPQTIQTYSLKAETANHAILDSIYELKYLGYFGELYRWYYHYSKDQKPDTLWRYFFNANGEFEQITEIRSYNANEQLVSLVRKKPGNMILPDFITDTALAIAYLEEYRYEGVNLVQKTVISHELAPDTSDTYYFYDAGGRLTHDSIVEYGASGWSIRSGFDNTYIVEYGGFYLNIYVSNYSYNKEGEPETILYSNTYNDSITSYQFLTYAYKKTDSTRQITRNEIYLHDQPMPDPDTITQWEFMDRFYETYDKAGRRKSVMLIKNDIYYGERMDYRAAFTWTESGQLLHASYFTWEADGDTGVWAEATRIDNRYDAYGNLLQYDKTFYDARTGKWETEHNKTYYYTYLETGLPERMVKTGSLSIFPNPVTDEIRVSGLSGKSLRYTVYSLYGQSVTSGIIEDQVIHVSHLKPGFYILEIRNDHSRYSGRFIKY